MPATGSRIRKRQERPALPLKRERIVATALAIVDRDGLKALSMRKLGAELGVDPMAVYHHIPNKEALLDAIVEAVMGAIDLSIDPRADSAEERILCAAEAYLKAMLAHANALPIVLTRGPATVEALRPVELLIGILREAGLSPAGALAGMNGIAAAVRGFAAMLAHGEGEKPTSEQREALAKYFPPGQFPYLREAVTDADQFSDRGFEFGIRALARGLLAATQRTEEAR
jgi:AcrR family transcriptional regulator